jgi:hypothetical protein
MKYVTVWTIPSKNLAAAVQGFKDGDPVAASRYTLAWADLIDLRVYPVIDDAQIAKALS